MTNNDSKCDVEDDYMSDVFIEKSESVRPGLVTGRLAKVYKQQARPKNVTKSMRTLQEEGRQEGLKKEISSDNVGFKLLSKMGFNKETGIGKKGNGIREPISVVLKSDRAGLGHSNALKRLQEERVFKERSKRSMTEKRWREMQRQKASEVSCEKDLRASQKACLQLDQAQGLETPIVRYYWLPDPVKEAEEEEEEEEKEDEEEEEEEEDISSDDKLIGLTAYLREIYFFCVWCGIKFKDKEDMNSECPGNSASSHDDG